MRHDFFAISNGLAGVHKNVKICLYCIRHGNSSFLDNFLWFYRCGAKLPLLSKSPFFTILQKWGFPEFNKNNIFPKIVKNGVPWNFTFSEKYDFSKNVIFINVVKYHFSESYKVNTFWNSILLTYYYYYWTEYSVCIVYYT